jgi:cytochrome c oxidase subunit 2
MVTALIRKILSNRARLLMLAGLAVMLALVFAGCETDTPQNTFDAQGEVAEKQRDLFYLAMWPALAIMVLVLLGIVVMVLRYRERDPESAPPPQTHGNTRVELAWTIAPAILLLVLGIPMVALIYDLGEAPAEDAYRINVTGQRYSFTFEYPEILDDNGNPLLVIDEPHIPTGRQVAFHLNSIDVIHSFWLPKLGGKLDVIPGQENVLWLVAGEPQSYSGQCAEYCGLEHANMKMTVIADEPEDFEKWVREQSD